MLVQLRVPYLKKRSQMAILTQLADMHSSRWHQGTRALKHQAEAMSSRLLYMHCADASDNTVNSLARVQRSGLQPGPQERDEQVWQALSHLPVLCSKPLLARCR